MAIEVEIPRRRFTVDNARVTEHASGQAVSSLVYPAVGFAVEEFFA